MLPLLMLLVVGNIGEIAIVIVVVVYAIDVEVFVVVVVDDGEDDVSIIDVVYFTNCLTHLCWPSDFVSKVFYSCRFFKLSMSSKKGIASKLSADDNQGVCENA